MESVLTERKVGGRVILTNLFLETEEISHARLESLLQMLQVWC